MGEHISEDLGTSITTVTVSRKRALQLIGGALAVATPAVASQFPQAVEAGQQAKAPQAVVAATLLDIVPSSGGTFTWSFHGAVVHLDSGAQTRLQSSGGLAATATKDEARQRLGEIVRERAQTALQNNLGLTVQRNRIAVTLL